MNRTLLGLFFLLFVVLVILGFQIFYLIERPRKKIEKEKISILMLENEYLKERIKKLLIAKKELSSKIKEKPKEIVRYVDVVKYVKDPMSEKKILELERENKNNRKIIKELQDEILIKKKEIEALREEIKINEAEKASAMSSLKDVMNDEEREKIKSLEKERLIQIEKILSLQGEIANLSEKVEKLSSQNELSLKEKEILKEKLVLLENENKRIINEANSKIEEILDNIKKEKKAANRKSITENLLSMFLLWKK